MNTNRKIEAHKVSPDRRKLTPLLIEKIKPGVQRNRIWDTSTRGLVLQIEPGGSKSWYMYYRRNGRPRWYRLGAVGSLKLRAAREAVSQLTAKLTLDPAYDPQVEKVSSRMQGTVADLVTRYVSDHLSGLKSGHQGTFLLRRYVVPILGKAPIVAVSRADIRTLLAGIGSATTRKQVHANLSGMFNWAMRNDYLDVAVNPATGIVSKATTARERVLADNEVPLFWDAVDEVGLNPGRALRMVLLTGQRPGEVRHMRWQDIDIGEHTLTDDNGRTYTAQGAWWTLQGKPVDDGTWPGTKNGQTHRVWLSKPAMEMILELKEERDDSGKPSSYVFHGQGGRLGPSLDKPMRQVCENLNIKLPDKVTPHDLRRSHGTTVTSLGFTRDQMNRLQNHREGGIASVYDRHSYMHEARVVQEAVADRLMALVFDDHQHDKVVSIRN